MLPFLLALGALASPAVAAERRFTVTDFDRVEVQGPFQVVLKTGRSNGAVARGTPQALDRVSIEVQGRLLRVKPSLSGWGNYPGEAPGPASIELSTHDLRSVLVQGSGSLGIDAARAMRFSLAVFGSGSIALDALEADVLDLSLVGSGRIAVGGRAKNVRATVEGAGDLDALKLQAQDLLINAGTSGTVAASALRTAKVNSSGSGDVSVAGSPACTVDRRGSGAIACGSSR